MADGGGGPIDWSTFYVEHRRALFVYALSLSGGVDGGHDLLHDVFARLIAERVAPTNALGYVLRCVRNLAIDRRRVRRGDVALDAVTSAAFLADEPRGAGDETAAIVRATLAALPESQREPIVLRIYAGLTIEEAADVLGRPFGTVASAYSRGLAELRRRLAGVMDDDGPGTRTAARQPARPGA